MDVNQKYQGFLSEQPFAFNFALKKRERTSLKSFIGRRKPSLPSRSLTVFVLGTSIEVHNQIVKIEVQSKNSVIKITLFLQA